LGTIDACFQFMKAAQAKRKIFVIGTISDYDSSASVEYVRVAKRAQEIADITIFVGAWAPSVLKARKPGREHALRVFSHVRDAAEYINSITREGDLVLLKGSNKQDHLLRIILARTGDIACWREDCERYSFCNECADRNKPSGFPILMGNATISGATSQALPPDGNAIDSDGQVIIGLGNFESKYAGTPHNIGHEVVNRMAASLALVWETTPEAWIARGSSHGRGLCLIKIRTAMNLTGVGLKRLSESMGFAPDQCVLVFDDLDTPLGAVRTRMNGGAGGHRGVASILEAFQTDEFRRVKIGVGQSGVKLDPAKYVLTAFDAASRAAVDPAIPIGEAHVLELVKRRGTAKPQ
jgi:UDP-N-acetylmuramoyl-tripeptide--D-alanyl-D-alanine ligase